MALEYKLRSMFSKPSFHPVISAPESTATWMDVLETTASTTPPINPPAHKTCNQAPKTLQHSCIHTRPGTQPAERNGMEWSGCYQCSSTRPLLGPGFPYS
ncbi:hypothetical protein BJX70DRAFT_359484 [Aspergillus crustosus]